MNPCKNRTCAANEIRFAKPYTRCSAGSLSAPTSEQDITDFETMSCKFICLFG